MNFTVPPISYLGVAEKAARVRDENTNAFKLNIIGLKNHVLSNLYPIPFNHCHIISIFNEFLHENIDISFISPDGLQIGNINISLQNIVEDQLKVEDVVIKQDGSAIAVPHSGWFILAVPPEVNSIFINSPGEYSVYAKIKDQNVLLSKIYFALIDPEPLSESRISAIKSNPKAIKYLRSELKCKICNDSIRTYTSTEQLPRNEADGYIWYKNLPDSFTCKCGSTSFDLTIYRRNLFALLGNTIDFSGEVDHLRLYEKSALSSIRNNFAALINEELSEEKYQIFIKENPILFSRFAPELIFFKSPILTSYNTDFTILTSEHQLLLIEIEKPTTKILKKDGGMHSELQHAFDQTRDWLNVMDEQRLAALDCIGIERQSVGKIQAVVIAGKDSNVDSQHLRKLKSNDYGRILFLTYDDILSDLDNLIRNFNKL